MKKGIKYMMILMVIVLSLSGCITETYEQEEVDAAARKGAEMIQTWLDENMPEAELGECKAVTAWTYYEHKDYLTDYVSGQVSLNGSVKKLTINTVTGEVYWEMDNAALQELTAVTESYFYEALASVGIVPESVKEGYALQCYVMALVGEGEMAKKIPGLYFMDCGLPEGVENLEKFVRDPRSRLPIYVQAPELTVADTVDLSGYDLAVIEKLEEKYGLHMGSLSINNSNQILTKIDKEDRVQIQLLEHGKWYEADGFELNGWVRKRQEFRNMETKEVTVSDLKVDTPADIAVKKTDYGYHFSLLNQELDTSLTLRAYEGAEILKHEYYCLDEEKYQENHNPAQDGDETSWREVEDGWYVLTRSTDGTSLAIGDGDLLVRKE